MIDLRNMVRKQTSSDYEVNYYIDESTFKNVKNILKKQIKKANNDY